MVLWFPLALGCLTPGDLIGELNHFPQTDPPAVRFGLEAHDRKSADNPSKKVSSYDSIKVLTLNRHRIRKALQRPSRCCCPESPGPSAGFAATRFTALAVC
jgi:hypothetical protein